MIVDSISKYYFKHTYNTKHTLAQFQIVMIKLDCPYLIPTWNIFIFTHSIQATQDKGEFPSEVAGYSVADNQALREVSRG